MNHVETEWDIEEFAVVDEIAEAVNAEDANTFGSITFNASHVS